MASQILNLGLSLNASNINGLLTLDKDVNTTITYNDQDVATDTITVAHGAATELVTTTVGADVYVYLKNTDTVNKIKTQISAGTNYGSINPGDFSFYCVKEGEGLKVQATTANIVLEYITFKKA
tara:strand:+ start:919 stop:1290 length:372 start_codon:yes stop_codon:yes gene_type:complete